MMTVCETTVATVDPEINSLGAVAIGTQKPGSAASVAKNLVRARRQAGALSASHLTGRAAHLSGYGPSGSPWAGRPTECTVERRPDAEPLHLIETLRPAAGTAKPTPTCGPGVACQRMYRQCTLIRRH